MSSVSASLDYFVHHALRTLSQDDKVSAFAFICGIVSLISQYSYSVDALSRMNFMGQDFTVVGLGIITYGLYKKKMNLNKSYFLLYVLEYYYFERIKESRRGKISSSLIWGMLLFPGYLFLKIVCIRLSLVPMNIRSSLARRFIHHYCYIRITHSRRYGICLRFTSILLVIPMICTALIPDISLFPRSQMMLTILIIFVKYELPTQTSIYSIYIGLESSESIGWSYLPQDLACETVNRMTTFKDYIAAIWVSQVWRSAGSGISRGPQLNPLPLLMLSEESEPLLTDMRTSFSLYDNSHHRLQLSEVCRKRIWGSQHGWVVTLGPRYATQLVHLITGNGINLPQMQRLAPREEWFCLVHKFNLLKDPTNESTFLVIAIFGPMNSLAFTRVRLGLGAALNRRGEGEWVVVDNLENLKFKDVAHLNDQIYALCDNGKLVRFEPDALLADMVLVIAEHPQDVWEHQKIYLVESLGNLYGVFRNGFLIPSERRFETTSFFVYKFNFNASAWEEVTHLEGQAFFVGDGNSFSRRFPTSIIPSRSDCIYFTDDHWDWEKYLSGVLAFGGHDVGVFVMATWVILTLPFGKDKPLFYSRPIFTTRNDEF